MAFQLCPLLLSGNLKNLTGGREQNYNPVFHSNAAELYSSAKAIIFSGKRGGGEGAGRREEVEEENKNEEEEEVEEEITTAMQSSATMQQSCTHTQGDCFLLSGEQSRGEGEKCGGRGGGGGEQ